MNRLEGEILCNNEKELGISMKWLGSLTFVYMRTAPNQIKLLVGFRAHLRVRTCKGALWQLHLH
jgi:hypothetical protein